MQNLQKRLANLETKAEALKPSTKRIVTRPGQEIQFVQDEAFDILIDSLAVDGFEQIFQEAMKSGLYKTEEACGSRVIALADKLAHHHMLRNGRLEIPLKMVEVWLSDLTLGIYHEDCENCGLVHPAHPIYAQYCTTTDQGKPTTDICFACGGHVSHEAREKAVGARTFSHLFEQYRTAKGKVS